MAAAKPVLVVDDDPSICEFVSIALREEGYRVGAAADGREALQCVVRDPPALILLDLWMPVMDGAAFLHAYRRTPPPHAPVVIFAASPDADPTVTPADVAGYLPKPVDLADLVREVERLTRPG